MGAASQAKRLTIDDIPKEKDFNEVADASSECTDSTRECSDHDASEWESFSDSPRWPVHNCAHEEWPVLGASEQAHFLAVLADPALTPVERCAKLCEEQDCCAGVPQETTDALESRTDIGACVLKDSALDTSDEPLMDATYTWEILHDADGKPSEDLGWIMA